MTLDKVLVVEDSEDVLNMVCENIKNDEQCSCEVIEARNGREAVEKYKRYNPKVIVLDLMLPEGDGLFVMRQIKKKFSENEKPYIIIITASENYRLQFEAELFGVHRYIEKPFKISELLEPVRECLRK